MNLDIIYNAIIYPWLGLGIFTFILLFFITAPYGRHSKTMGPMMSGKWGWIIQETISPLCFGYFFLVGNSVKTPAMWVFFALWIGHYFNRSVIYPFRQKSFPRYHSYWWSIANTMVCIKTINEIYRGKFKRVATSIFSFNGWHSSNYLYLLKGKLF